ncbi:NfeD family protein [Qipengyuania sp. SM2507]
MDGIEAHWFWFAAGLILAGLEMVVPGVYLMWLAMAALATGVITLVALPSLAVQVTSFIFLSLIFAFSARRMLRDRPIVSSDPLLNNRGGRLTGQTALVTQALVSGSGRIKVGDSEWIARGPDMAVGERVRITGSDGSELLVEPVGLIIDQDPAGKA